MSHVLVEDLSLERSAFNADDDDFDLFRAAALLGRIEEPELDVAPLSEGVERLAARVLDHIPAGAAWPAPLGALVEVLFHEEGFVGDEEEYDAPHNSFLHRVVERRRGLPIALSVLTCEVARRAGIAAYGIGFPGHFLVGVQSSTEEEPIELVVIDPFHKGRPVGPKELERRLEEVARRPVELMPEHLSAAAPTAILTRMLTNLRGSYVRRQDNERLVRVLSRLLILKPDDIDALCDRALARRDLLDAEGAQEDARVALGMAPLGHPARERARKMLVVLEEDRRWLN